MRMSLILLLAPLLIQAALADDAARTVTVDGQAFMTVQPDRAVLNLGVFIRERDLDSAREQTNGITREFLAFARSSGVADEKITTSGATIRPEYRWNNASNQQDFLGYTVRREIVIELDDLDKLGEILEGAVDAGVNQVNPPRLLYSRERELRRDALAAATRDAEANARRMAETLGVTLGSVREISSTEFSVPEPRFARERVMMANAADVGGADTYQTGEIRVEARVTARFDLEDDR